LWPRVIPAKVGIQETSGVGTWMPAYAGMTFSWCQLWRRVCEHTRVYV